MGNCVLGSTKAKPRTHPKTSTLGYRPEIHMWPWKSTYENILSSTTHNIKHWKWLECPSILTIKHSMIMIINSLQPIKIMKVVLTSIIFSERIYAWVTLKQHTYRQAKLTYSIRSWDSDHSVGVGARVPEKTMKGFRGASAALLLDLELLFRLWKFTKLCTLVTDALLFLYIKPLKRCWKVTKWITFSLYWNHPCLSLLGLETEKAAGKFKRGLGSLSEIKGSKIQAQWKGNWGERKEVGEKTESETQWELSDSHLTTLPNFSLTGAILNPAKFSHTLMLMLSTLMCMLMHVYWQDTDQKPGYHTKRMCEGSNLHPQFQPGPASVWMPQRLEPRWVCMWHKQMLNPREYRLPWLWSDPRPGLCVW